MENAVCCALSACPDLPVVCLTVKPVGKPGAENRHARFDERGWETERWPKAPSYCARPRLYLFDVRRGVCGDRSNSGYAGRMLKTIAEAAHLVGVASLEFYLGLPQFLP